MTKFQKQAEPEPDPSAEVAVRWVVPVRAREGESLNVMRRSEAVARVLLAYIEPVEWTPTRRELEAGAPEALAMLDALSAAERAHTKTSLEQILGRRPKLAAQYRALEGRLAAALGGGQ